MPTDLGYHMMAALANTLPEFVAACEMEGRGTQVGNVFTMDNYVGAACDMTLLH